MHYLDHAATTYVSPLVIDTVSHVLANYFANPSSLYAIAADSEEVINKSRGTLASMLGCTASEIRFTGSGTESNNLAILGACEARKNWANHIVVTGYEHPSVHNVCKSLEKSGWNVSYIMPSVEGVVDVQSIASAVTSKTALVSAMHINNEIGSIIDVEALAKKVKEINSRTAVHVDGVQAFGKKSVSLSKTKIDSYSVSGHKIYAPKGIGVLYLRKGYNITQTILGGSQEFGFRAGTENIAYIAGLAKAVSLMPQKPFEPFHLKQELISNLQQMEEITINSPENAHPCIVNFSVKGIKSETMLHFLESHEIYVSSGSACSKGAPSHTLTAMSLPRERVDTAIRVSFGSTTTKGDIKALVDALKIGVSTIAKIRR